MFKIELVPDLVHCIHTVTRREYEDTLGRLLSAEDSDTQLRKKLELLTVLLKEMDFQQLRRESEKHILGGKEVSFIFYLENNIPKYEMRVY